MLSRIGWSSELSWHFSWKLRVWIAGDCPLIGWHWLWFAGCVWLLPHDESSGQVLLGSGS